MSSHDALQSNSLEIEGVTLIYSDPNDKEIGNACSPSFA